VRDDGKKTQIFPSRSAVLKTSSTTPLFIVITKSKKHKKLDYQSRSVLKLDNIKNIVNASMQ